MHPHSAASSDFDARVRRISVLIYAVAIVNTWLVANLPLGIPALDRRTLNLLTLPALLSLIAVLYVPWQRFHRHLFLVMTFSALMLIALAVRASGGWQSPLALFYLLIVLFNAAYYARSLALVLDGAVVLWSLSPVFFQPTLTLLLIHLVLFGPICLSVGVVADLMMREVRRREGDVGILVARQAQGAREYARLTALHQAGVAVSAQLDARQVIETVVHELAISLGYPYVGIYLREEAGLRLCAEAGYAAPLEWIREDQGVIGRVCRTGHGTLVPDVRADPDYLGAASQVRSEVCVPILEDGAVIGIVNVESGTQLGPDDLEVLELFAQQISAALANARVHAAMTEAARRDGMTGILNRGAMLAAFEQMIAETGAAGGALALLYLDLDGFKHLNDRYGHAFGDDVLRTCVQVMETSLSPSALLGRYGGEEFLVVLPDADHEQGLLAAEAIRADMAAYRFPAVDGGEPIRVTLSIGVACLPGHATTATTLLQRADEALYTAKAQGRNCTRVASDLVDASR